MKKGLFEEDMSQSPKRVSHLEIQYKVRYDDQIEIDQYLFDFIFFLFLEKLWDCQ
jgi:hypothetical protein